MHIATISSQRQITLPKSMLESIGAKVGDKLWIKISNGSIVAEKERDISELAGCLRPYIHPSKLGVPYEEAKRVAIEQMIREKAGKNVSS